MRRGHSQYVTGLSVSENDKPYAPRQLKRFVRLWQHILDKEDGVENYGGEFGDLQRLDGLQRYIDDIEGCP